MLFVWYPDDRSDLQKVDEETNLIEDWGSIKDQLKAKNMHVYISDSNILEIIKLYLIDQFI